MVVLNILLGFQGMRVSSDKGEDEGLLKMSGTTGKVKVTCSFSLEQSYLPCLQSAVQHWENSVRQATGDDDTGSQSLRTNGGVDICIGKSSKKTAKTKKTAVAAGKKKTGDTNTHVDNNEGMTDNEQILITTDQYVDLILECAIRLTSMMQVSA